MEPLWKWIKCSQENFINPNLIRQFQVGEGSCFGRGSPYTLIQVLKLLVLIQQVCYFFVNSAWRLWKVCVEWFLWFSTIKVSMSMVVTIQRVRQLRLTPSNHWIVNLLSAIVIIIIITFLRQTLLSSLNEAVILTSYFIFVMKANLPNLLK